MSWLSGKTTERQRAIIAALDAGFSLFDVCWGLKQSYYSVLAEYRSAFSTGKELGEPMTSKKGFNSSWGTGEIAKTTSYNTGVKDVRLWGEAKYRFSEFYTCRKAEIGSTNSASN